MDNASRSLGKRIKIARIESDVSQESLAYALGVATQPVSAWESGRNQISAVMLHQIAHELNKPVAYFFEPFGGVESVESKEMRRQGSPPDALKKDKRGKRKAA